MKKYKYLLLVTVTCFSCNYLDKKPDNLLTEEQIWQTRANAEGYLHNIYAFVDNTDGDDFATMGAADESNVLFTSVAVQQMVRGNWSAASGYFNNWSNYYAAIRKTFVFEQNIGKVPPSQLSDELKAQYGAENLFLRGYFYWQLLRQYGPYVKVDGLLDPSASSFEFPRATFDDCVANINALMDRAAANLPAVWASASNYGRPTSGACLAFKAKAAQLAASPLWNGNNRFAGFKNPDGTPLAPATYDENKWRIAANAAKAVIDAGNYKLYTNLENGGGAFDPYLSVRDIFRTNWNSEIIFGTLDWWRWGWTKCASPGPGGYNMYHATQNLVDAFAMNNGRTIDDPASGYVETGFIQNNSTKSWGHRKGEWNMYANREPRFYAYVQYNGHPVLPAITTDDKNFFSSEGNINGEGRAELYYSGKSGQKNTSGGTTTGYLVLKRMGPDDNIRTDQVSYHGPFIIIRYAEILLDYVEALNEYDPNNADILKYLNEVRTRAGLPDIQSVYPQAAGNKDEMRKHILRERNVELCFEMDRYYTLTRRLLMGRSEYRTIYGLDVNANDNGQGFSFTGFYTKKLFQRRHWEDKMYLFPIFQGDIERNRAMVQNPGW